jgi:hypothetical protein
MTISPQRVALAERAAWREAGKLPEIASNTSSSASRQLGSLGLFPVRVNAEPDKPAHNEGS